MVNKFFDTLRDMTIEGAQNAPTTENKIGDILTERERVAAQMLDLAANGNFGNQVVPDGYGGTVEVASGDSKQLAALADTFDILGDLAKTGSGAGGLSEAANVLSANTAAQIAQQDRQLAESMRQFDIGNAENARQFDASRGDKNQQFADSLAFNREELATTEAGAMSRLQASIASEEKRAADQLREQERQANLSSTLDMLTAKIRTGELGVAEASNRITAATSAANVQRDILADHAGKALPAGTKYYPNLGPGGPIAAMAGALGQPFKPFETMGTFAIDPNAIAAPISQAPGASMLPGADQAIAQAAAALAGMGVPQMAEGGPVRGPYISGEAGPELNFPMGNGQSYVMNMRQAMQGMQGNQGGVRSQPMPSQTPAGAYVPPAFAAFMQGLIPSGGGRPDYMALIQQLFSGLGVVPPTQRGAGMRAPQVGMNSAARSLAGV